MDANWRGNVPVARAPGRPSLFNIDHSIIDILVSKHRRFGVVSVLFVVVLILLLPLELWAGVRGLDFFLVESAPLHERVHDILGAIPAQAVRLVLFKDFDRP